MNEIRLQIPRLHKAQRRTNAEAARFNVWCCGRRFGKSVLSRRRLLHSALQGSEGLSMPTAYFAPTYRMLDEYWRETVAELFPLIETINKQQHRIGFYGGGSLDMWSLDEPNAARGRKYFHIAIDEAAVIARLEEAWMEVLRPTLADYQGQADFYSTPKGRNYFWQLWTRGQDPLQPNWKSWKLPTTCNPFISPSEIEVAKAETPETVFRQEYLAEFLEDAGLVFRGIQESCTARWQDEGIPNHQYIGAIDWGRNNDFTVITIIDVTLGEQCYIERFTEMDFQRQMAAIQRVCGLFYMDALMPERNSFGIPLCEELERASWAPPVYAFTTTQASKASIIQGLQLGLELRELKLLDHPQQVAELQAYEEDRTINGVPKYSAPPGLHDDTVMALAIAWHGCKTQNEVVAF